jgi:hypothetical protein
VRIVFRADGSEKPPQAPIKGTIPSTAAQVTTS